jgi:hypothetical protein
LRSNEKLGIKKTGAAKYVGGHPDYPSSVVGTLTITKDELTFASEKIRISVLTEKISESLVISKADLGKFLDPSVMSHLIEDKKFLSVSYDDEGGTRKTLILEVADPEGWAKTITGYAYSEYLEE